MRRCAKSGLKEAIKSGNDYWIQRFQIYDFECDLRCEKYELALERFKNLINSNEISKFPDNEVLANFNIAECYRRRYDDYSKALEFDKKAKTLIEINITQFDQITINNVLNNLALDFIGLGDYDSAIDVYLKLETTVIDLIQKSKVYHQLGVAYYHKGEVNKEDLNKAIEYFEQALEIVNQFNNTKTKANYSSDLGYAYLSASEWKSAESSFNYVLDISEKKDGFQEIRAAALRGKSHISENSGNHEETCELIKEAYTIMESIGKLNTAEGQKLKQFYNEKCLNFGS